MRRGESGDTDRDRAKARGRSRRGRERGGRGARHRTVTCPGCKGNIPYLENVQEPPAVCGGCGYRLRCENCGADISTHEDRYPTDEFGRSVGDPEPDPDICPRCGNPADGSDEALTPEDESFTWDDR